MGTSSSPLSNVSQPLQQNVAAVASGTGTATFTFQSPPTGLVWTGTLQCATNAAGQTVPTGAVFNADIGALNWGSWGGNSVYGPIQANGTGADQLVVTATGLTAGVTYQMAWIGTSDQADKVAAIWPDVNSSALTATISGTVGIAGTVATNTNLTGGTVGTITNPVNFQPFTTAVIGPNASILYNTGTTNLGPYTLSNGCSQFIFRTLESGFTSITLTNTTLGFTQTLTFSAGFNYAQGQQLIFQVPGRTGDSITMTLNGLVGGGASFATTLMGLTNPLEVQVVNDEGGRSLDVLPYGGQLYATVGNVAAGVTGAQILADAVSGYSYRIHSWGIIPTNVSATGVVWLIEKDAFGISFQALHGSGIVTNANTWSQFQQVLEGQLAEVNNQLWVINRTTQTLTFFIHYDVVLQPTIQ